MKNFILALLITPGLLFASWTSQKEEALTAQAEEKQASLLIARPTFHWPFDQATRAAMMRLKQDEIPLFAYGSLINEESAARTLSPKTLQTRQPAIAFGVRRLFNYDPGLERYTAPPTPRQRAMLNIRYTGDTNDIVNGVVVKMSKEDLIALSEREIGYDLIPVVVVDWNDALDRENPIFYTAYTFSAPQSVNPDLLPRPDYYKRVVDGAKSYGEDYLELWYNTTYLGDGETPVRHEHKD